MASMAQSTPASDPKERKKDILQDIKRYCKQYEGEKKKVETVLMLGQTGVGKSAAINTVAKLVNGEYFPIAKVGEGVAQSKTKEFITYKNCGARMDMPRKHTEDDEDELFERITQYLPHIIDFAGLDDVDTSSLREIFELLIEGYIPPGTTIKALERDQKKYGVGCLRSIYKTPNPAWKVTKIVFAHSCRKSVPTNLINCLLSTLNTTVDGANSIRYTGDIYLLITKYDLVAASDNQNMTGSSEGHEVSMEDFQRIESTLARQFNITGALEHNRLRFASYCSDTGYANDNIDELALKLIKLLVMPTLVRDYPLPPDTPWMTRLMLELQKFIGQVNFTRRDCILFIVAAVVVLFFARALSIGATN